MINNFTWVQTAVNQLRIAELEWFNEKLLSIFLPCIVIESH